MFTNEHKFAWVKVYNTIRNLWTGKDLDKEIDDSTSQDIFK